MRGRNDVAACNLAMRATWLLAGSGAYSLATVLLRRNPSMAGRAWFQWLGGSLALLITDIGFRNLGLLMPAAVAGFGIAPTAISGSVVTPFHSGPVSPNKHHLSLANGVVLPDGSVRFHIYLDGGTPEASAHVMEAALLGPGGQVVASWDAATLTKLPASADGGERPQHYGAAP